MNEIDDIIEKNMLIKVNDKMYLTKGQVNSLEKHNIHYQNCNSLKEILFLIDQEELDDELEEIALEISEFDYYNNTKK